MQIISKHRVPQFPRWYMILSAVIMFLLLLIVWTQMSIAPVLLQIGSHGLEIGLYKVDKYQRHSWSCEPFYSGVMIHLDDNVLYVQSW